MLVQASYGITDVQSALPCTTQTLSCFVFSALCHLLFKEWAVMIFWKGKIKPKKKTYDQRVSGPAADSTSLELVLRL